MLQDAMKLMMKSYLDDIGHEAAPIIDVSNDREVYKDQLTVKEQICDILESDISFEAKREFLLKVAIATEQMSRINYWISYMFTVTEGKADFDPQFEEHEDDEDEHAHDFANRLRELGCVDGIPPFDMWLDLTSHIWNQEFSHTSTEILKNRYIEELQAIEFYTLCVEFFRGTPDSTTYQLFKKVKTKEEEHAKDLRDLAWQYNLDI